MQPQPRVRVPLVPGQHQKRREWSVDRSSRFPSEDVKSARLPTWQEQIKLKPAADLQSPANHPLHLLFVTLTHTVLLAPALPAPSKVTRWRDRVLQRRWQWGGWDLPLRVGPQILSWTDGGLGPISAFSTSSHLLSTWPKGEQWCFPPGAHYFPSVLRFQLSPLSVVSFPLAPPFLPRHMPQPPPSGQFWFWLSLFLRHCPHPSTVKLLAGVIHTISSLHHPFFVGKQLFWDLIHILYNSPTSSVWFQWFLMYP